MGAETTPEQRVSEDLMQAVTCLKRVMNGMKHGNEVPEEEKPQNPTDVICTLEKLTGALERCMENNKTLNDVLSGKMKCTTCGSTSVGFLADCHDSATSTTTTTSHRSSEEPMMPRRKNSEDMDDVDDGCSSLGSRSIRSVSSQEDDETTLVADMIKEGGASKTVEEEEEEHDLVMKTILSTTTSTSSEIQKEDVRKESEDVVPITTDGNNTALFDQFLQNSLLGLPDMKAMIDMPPTVSDENNEDENQESNALLSNFFQILFANNQNGVAGMEGGSSETDSTSSQPSPPADLSQMDPSQFDTLAMLESLMAESLNPADATTSAENKAKKRKNTPIKVPKSENGGYVCPMEGCNKIFKEKGSVHRHFVTHIGMRFNCDKCKASYTQKHALMLHQKIHLNPDAYQCRGCGTNYTTQNGLRLHRQRNPACMEHNTSATMSDFNSSLNDVLSLATAQSTPTKQMVMAAP
ncbi:unnamed protein product [Caenorhabditis nigoni]